MFTSEYLPTYLMSLLIMWFVVRKLNCSKISLVSRHTDKRSDFRVISITHVVAVCSLTLIPYVFLEIKILRVNGTLSTLLEFKKDSSNTKVNLTIRSEKFANNFGWKNVNI